MASTTPQPYNNTPGTPVASDRYNVLAIVGFILAFLINIVGLILSIIALNQIKRTGERGHGLALAGVIISALSIIISIISAIVIVIAAPHMGTTTH